MSSLISRSILLIALLLALPSGAVAGVCDSSSVGRSTGPVAFGILEGGLGEGHRACARSEMSFAFGGMLLVDLPNFYGRASADLRMAGSYAILPNLEVYGRFEVFRLDALITPLSTSTMGLGHTNIGMSARFLESPKAALSVHSQVVLPTAAPLYHNSRPLAFDLGLAGQFALHEKVQLHADVGLIHSAGIGGGPSWPRVGATATAGVELLPSDRVAVVVDLLGGFGYSAPVDLFAVAAAFRATDGKRFGFDVGATIPVAGRERANVRLDLRWTFRFGALPGENEEPVEEPAEEPADEPSDEPAEEPGNEPVDEPGQEPTEEPAEEPEAAPAGG